MTEYAGYNVELDKIEGCPEVSGGLPIKYFRIPSLKKDPEYDVSVDTSYLGAGAVEHIQVHDSTTELFKILNPAVGSARPEMLITTKNLTCAPSCTPSLINSLKFGAPKIFTDCGNNSTGIPIYTIQAGENVPIKLPITITGNWTPQIKTGHILLEGEDKTPKLALRVFSYTANAPCIAAVSNTDIHILNTEQLKEILCTGKLTPIDFYRPDGSWIPPGYVSIHDGDNQSIAILDDVEPSCVSLPGTYHVQIAGSGRAAFDSVVGAIHFGYRRQDGSIADVLVANSPTPGAITAEFQVSTPSEVVDHQAGVNSNYCSRPYTRWGYTQSVPFVSYGSASYGTSATASCGNVASIVGNTGSASAGVDNGHQIFVGIIPLGDAFTFTESASFAVSATANTVTVAATGTVTVSFTCGAAEPVISMSCTFTEGTHSSNNITDSVNKCFGPIKPPYDVYRTTESAWSEALVVSFPISTRKIVVEVRMVASVGAEQYINGLIAAIISGAVQARVVYKE